MNDSSQDSVESRWAWALPVSLAILALYLYLFYRWFALADRYRLFLYYHDMGPLVPDTSPFSFVTASRYWMTGLVAGGVLLILTIGLNWLLGRMVTGWQPPTWWRVWLLTTVPLLVAIPLLTMTTNEPTLPAGQALRVTLFALTGLVLALLPGRLAAEDPGELLLLGIDGLGLMLIITTLVGLERLAGWLERGATLYLAGMILSVVLGLILLCLASATRFLLGRPGRGPRDIFLAGLIGAYLILPLLHHISFTDGYYYITDADNFLSRSPFLQAGIWLLAAGLAAAFFRLRLRVVRMF